MYSFRADQPTGNMCGYFMKYVAPGDPDLYAEYVQCLPVGHPLKLAEKTDDMPNCTECGRPFARKSNSQKYCTTCKYEVRRKQKAENERKRRTNTMDTPK
ncbi:hypothetical protein HUG15_00340 [Salicibibacter cibarius]|uniref:Cysteine-rich VLP domain-containing protein n=1 Tax=Salicibibacter cibarius TaxID=2743000 RepID=A0A7T6Z058_9BACI|nr:hypothetical protein HUG15_00340 [Salicibibacter cibarius]